jgi:hypothetical protein
MGVNNDNLPNGHSIFDILDVEAEDPEALEIRQRYLAVCKKARERYLKEHPEEEHKQDESSHD